MHVRPNTSGAFAFIRPSCVALSAVSLQRPNDAAQQVKALRNVLLEVRPDEVTQGLGNYIFFPLKPLLRSGIDESILLEVFEIIRWLTSTAWYDKSESTTAQLIILLTNMFAKAKSEELKLTLIAACATLFEMATDSVNVLEARPSLAHLVTMFLAESASVELRCGAMISLRKLYGQLIGDAVASFLPGTVSALSRILIKVNQKSSVIIAGLNCLQTALTKCLNGEITAYRTEKWLSATQQQLNNAMTPIMSHLITTEHDGMRAAASELCVTLLQDSTCSPAVFIEFLLQVDPTQIPSKYVTEVASIVEMYIDSSTRILQGVDEQRKLSMLNTLTRAIPRLSPSSADLLCTRYVENLLAFVKITTGSGISAVSDQDAAPSEPDIEYLSAGARDALAKSLLACKSLVDIPVTNAESFWVAQKTGASTYQHALSTLATQTDLAIHAILQEAKMRGTAFDAELIHVLYPLLALPRPNFYVLEQISQICKYNSVQSMILSNADYIINSLSLSFVTLDVTPRTPLILGTLVQLAPQMAELVDDVVDIFFDFLDDYHGYSGVVQGIFAGLLGVVKAVVGQEPRSLFQKAIEASSEPPRMDDTFSERFEDVAEGESSAREIKDEEKDAESKSYNIVLHVMEKAQLFLSHGDDAMKISVLEVLYQGIPVVALNENKYLPLVHLYWPQLTRRLEDENPFVVASVLCVIARTVTFAGSFMRMRIKDDVVPFVREILHPAKDKRGNALQKQRQWQGTGRRKVAEGIQQVLKSVAEDGGLVGQERVELLEIVQELSVKSDVLRKVLEEAREIDRLV